MINKLPFDICRCRGQGCEEKETCLRYLDKELGFLTPITNTLRILDEKCRYKIEVEND